MSRCFPGIRWWALCVLSSGVLFQTTGSTAFADLVTSATVNLSSAVVNQVIRNSVNQFLGVPTTTSGLSSLTNSLTGTGT